MVHTHSERLAHDGSRELVAVRVHRHVMPCRIHCRLLFPFNVVC